MIRKYKIWIMLILCNLFWAGNYVFGKYVVAELSPLWITFTRWFLAGIILIIVAIVMEKPKWSEVFRAWPILAGMGILGIIGYNLVLYSALRFTSSTNAALVNALNPGLIFICSAFIIRERVSKLQVVGIILSLFGVIIILTKGSLSSILELKFNKGDLLMLLAIIVWTLYSLLGKRLKKIPPITVTAVSAGIAVIIMLPFVLLHPIDINKVGSVAVIGILYITIFPSLFSFAFWNHAVREVGAAKSGVFLNLIPVFTAIISACLGQQITLAQITGGIIVFIGVYLTSGLVNIRSNT